MTNTDPLTFQQVLDCFQQANKRLEGEDTDLEVWIGERMYRVIRVGQFNFVPTVTLTLSDNPELEL